MNSSLVTVVEQVNALLDNVDDAGTTGNVAGTPVDNDLTDEQLRGVLVGLEHVVNRAHALQAQVMVQMGDRASAADQAEVTAGGQPMWSRQCRAEFVADEIGVLLGCTKMAANVRYGTACQAAQMPVVGRAWRSGLLDARKVATICEQVSQLDAADAQVLAADGVGYATAAGRSRTAPQLREWLRRRVIAANPEAAEVRRQQAMGDRRVVVTPGEDGMSELWALLPSIQARQIQQSLTTAAHGLGAEDARSMDQRRADTLVDLLLGRAEPTPVTVQVVVPADTLTGASAEPGWVPGLGPVTATEINELIATGAGTGDNAVAGDDAGGGGVGVGVGSQVTFRRLLTDPTTGVLTDIAERRHRPSASLDRAVRARDVTCRFPGCRRAADSAGTDLDHTVPWPQGPTSAVNLAVLCRRHHRLKHTGGWTVTLDPTGTLTWTTPTGRTYQTQPWRYLTPDPGPPPDG